MALRQLPAACVRSAVVNSTWTSFSASAKVAAPTSGPTGCAVPNAGGVPGGGSGDFCCGVSAGFWALPRDATAAPKTRDASARNCLRDFDIRFPPPADYIWGQLPIAVIAVIAVIADI